MLHEESHNESQIYPDPQNQRTNIQTIDDNASSATTPKPDTLATYTGPFNNHRSQSGWPVSCPPANTRPIILHEVIPPSTLSQDSSEDTASYLLQLSIITGKTGGESPGTINAMNSECI